MVYGLDFDTGMPDTFNMIFNGYAYMVMMYIVAITRAAISVGWWLFSFTDVKPLTDATSATIGATGTQLVGWLLPSALAFGAVAAYTQRKATGSALGQLVWVFVAGVLSISFALAPATWLRGVDGARQLGAGAVMTASSDALGPTMQTPDAMAGAGLHGHAEGHIAQEVSRCELARIRRHALVHRGVRLDRGLRAIWQGHARRRHRPGGASEATSTRSSCPPRAVRTPRRSKWVKGDNPFGRIAVVMLAAIAATLFAFLNIALGIHRADGVHRCLLLLVVGVFFACLWIIPGRPRQWGLNWFEALIGLVLQSFLAMLVFGTALTLVTAVFTLTGCSVGCR